MKLCDIFKQSCFWILTSVICVIPNRALPDDRLGKIMISPRIGDATIISFDGRGTDKPSIQFRRELDDFAETCVRELSGEDEAASRRVAVCIRDAAKELSKKPTTRRAWCSRSTLYTEFGNFSLISADKQPTSFYQGKAYRNIIANWKDHRTEQILGNCGACNTPQLIDTFRVLCPREYASWFDGYDPR